MNNGIDCEMGISIETHSPIVIPNFTAPNGFVCCVCGSTTGAPVHLSPTCKHHVIVNGRQVIVRKAYPERDIAVYTRYH